jgi:thioredoxin reductase (NADPH)
MSTPYDVIVIGAGITGLTASKILARRGLSVANLEGGLFGGLVTNVNALEGAFEGSGADLASNLMMEIADLGCATLSESATGLLLDDHAVVVGTDAGEHRARSAVVATGAALKRLGVPGEAEYAYKGVSQCADCDGPMFQGQDVAVIGGGDSALQETLVLSEFCAQVHLLHRGAELTARPQWIEALRKRDNVRMTPHAEVTAIEGGDVVERVRARIGGDERVIPCAGVFAYVGLAPAAAFLPASVERDAQGAVVTGGSLETTLHGVFAAGAVRAGYGGTLTDAVGEAERAAAAVLNRIGGGGS